MWLQPVHGDALHLAAYVQAEVLGVLLHHLVGSQVGLVYDLFRKQLKEDPELQWDRIVDDMHAKDPWEDLRGVKHTGLRRKSYASLWECIDFHKLTVFTVDAAERQRFYMLCNLRKPVKSSIRSHVTRMETLNKYLGYILTREGIKPQHKKVQAILALNPPNSVKFRF